jgi:hypothetical protein
VFWVIILSVILALWASIATYNSLYHSNTTCTSCGRFLDQTTTCNDHNDLCCACHGHQLWE